MSLFGSLSSGVTGLLAQGESMSVISDNLSNVNTVGYKNTRTLFDQQVTNAGLSGTLYNSGGVGTSFERYQSSQGAFLSTQSSTDLALSGNGLFVVADAREIDTDTGFFYTRAGAFSEDNLGYLTTPSGHNLLGWRTESDGVIQDVQNPAPVELQSVGASARASAQLELGLNLTSSEFIHGFDTTGTFQAAIDKVVANPAGDTSVLPAIEGADFVTDVRFFDSQGSARDVSLAFIKHAANKWDWMMFSDNANVTEDVFGNPVNPTVVGNTLIGQGEMRFNADGSLKIATGINLDVAWAGGVEKGEITMDFGDYTGGFTFDPMPVGMQFGDHVLDLSIDENHLNAPSNINGVYTVINNGPVAGGYDLSITDPDANVWNVTVPNSADERVVEFGNGVIMTVSSAWTGAAFLGGAGGSINTTVPAVPTPPFDVGRGTDGVVQFDSPYNTLFANQNGFGSGTLASVSVDEEGYVVGSFTNGEAKKLWKLVIGVFQDPSELEPIGNNLLRETDASGRPLYKQAGVGGTATVVSGALEQSTVDIASEFATMIVAQRAFQASSTIITTVDQMLNELLQLR